MQGGVSLNDRKLAANIRRKLLKEAEKILDGKDEPLKRELLWKMCGTLLPRLQEHTGADGEKLFPAPLLAGKSNDPSNHSNKKATSTEGAN